MRWLVCGGRDFQDTQRVFACLDHVAKVVGKPEMLIVGDARGADSSAKLWAKHRQIPGIMVRANWKRDGKSAGPKRNARMLQYGPNLVIHFPGGAGTADMVHRAQAAEVETIEVPE